MAISRTAALRRPWRADPDWLPFAGLLGLLWLPELPSLWSAWRGDDTLGHGPLVPLIAGVLLWRSRARVNTYGGAAPWALPGLVLAALAYLLGVWAEIEVLQPTALVALAICGIGALRGSQAAAAGAGPLGFLLFMVPWPTTLVERIAFPMQMVSSAYAAMFAGILGLPIQREGVHLSVLGGPGGEPLYEVLVARQCSGLTSLIVLLALAYLIAYATPVPLGRRAVLLAAVGPLALAANALRLTLILVAGARGGSVVADWVHDHEAPVLLCLCCLGLLGLRRLLVSSHPSSPTVGTGPVSFPRAQGAIPTPVVCGVLALAALGAFWGRRTVQAGDYPRDYLAELVLPFRGWRTQDEPMSDAEATMLEPDAYLVRRYRAPDGAAGAELAVVAGHRKRTVHTPGFCMAGGGWEVVAQRSISLRLGDQRVPAVRTLMTKEGRYLLTTYFFTDGSVVTGSLVSLQVRQFLGRLRGGRPLGALVRVLVPMAGDGPQTEALADDFAFRVIPPVLARLRQAATGAG